MLDVHLSAGYGATETLHDIKLCLHKGDRAGLVGTSGAGKSTLVLALLGMLPWRKGWARGHVLFEGRDLLRCTERELRTLRGNSIALVPQSPATALNPAPSLQAHFDETWRAHAPRGDAMHARMQQLLQRVELPGDTAFLKRLPSQISIGQAQRVLIALALLHRPALLIADEPTSALDVCTQREIIHLLHELSHEEKTTLLYVSHDLISVLHLCETMLVMNRGSILETLNLQHPELHAEHALTRSLLDTLPAHPALLRQSFHSRLALPFSGLVHA